jgi:hypothetical protein
MPEKKVVRKETFYAPFAKFGFDIPMRDEDGKVIPLRDSHGNDVFRRGKLVPQERSISFNPIIERRIKNAEPLCYYEMPFIIVDGAIVPEDQEIYDALCKVADDPNTKVEREAAFKARTNPAAWEKEQELTTARNEVETLKVRLETKNAESEETVKKMERDMAELRKQLNSAQQQNRGNQQPPK